ncbi:hypothetical protein [Methylobacterium sp. 13MFTsu3.1M2]|uniref:hypothetical protein n=1 Tax=Methylobacterium sp. 13MFTsu3.1M2 TaxID=1502776 RepID=UPI001114E307|nr:hypothetical protein [Methylobacterium sp. 13MFTsu3.1M2]
MSPNGQYTANPQAQQPQGMVMAPSNPNAGWAPNQSQPITQAPITTTMLNNFQQLPTGGLDGGMGNLGSFLGGLF